MEPVMVAHACNSSSLEAEIRRITFRSEALSHPGQIVCKIPSCKNHHKKKKKKNAGGVDKTSCIASRRI
jgi:hypothetical protein